MFFKLNPEVVLNKGENNAILYNLISGEQLELNKDEVKVIEQLETNEHVGNSEMERDLITRLIQKKLGNYFSNKSHIEKIKTNKIASLQYDKLIPFKLNRLVIELTGRCNLDCKFCTKENIIYTSCSCKRWDNKKELTFNQWKNIIDQAVKLGIQECFICGGDPFLKWDTLKSIINYLDKIGIYCTIFTNGSEIDETVGHFLKTKKVSLALQVFSVEPKQFENITQTRNGFEKVQKCINIIDQHKINHSISIIVSRLNESSINDIKGMLGERIFQLIYLYPTNKYFSTKMLENMHNPDLRQFKIDMYSYPFVKKYNNCLYGQIFVSSEGKVFPCMMLRDFILGDLISEELWEIFYRKEHKKFWELSKSRLDICSNCEKNLTCFDCRALDYYATNRIKGMKYCNKIENIPTV